MSSTTVHDLKTLVQSMHVLITIDSLEEERVDALLMAVAVDLDMPYFAWSVTTGLRRMGAGQAVYGTGDPVVLLKHLRSLTVEGLFHLKDLQSALSSPAAVRALRETLQQFARSRSTIVLSGRVPALPGEIAQFAVPVELRLPGADELGVMLSSVTHAMRKSHRIEVQLNPEERDRVVQALSGLTLNQARQAAAWAMLDDGKLSVEDVPRLARRKAELIRDGGLLEYLPPDDNRFELGGFARLKAWLARARAGFGPEARALNLEPPRGVLIVGVQGCGKSLAAKIIARDWQLPLLKLDAARLYDKFIGESEKNLTHALELAERLAPVVLWIDEIEKGLAASGSADSDGGVSRRLLGSFLTWMQEREKGVFVAATANDVFSLPPEFLRKGRFDEIFFVDLPEDAEREAILRIHLALRKQNAEAFDLPSLVAATAGFSGAEIEQAIIASLYRALARKSPLTTDVLLEELRETVPLSVSRREDITRLRDLSKGRFVPVS